MINNTTTLVVKVVWLQVVMGLELVARAVVVLDTATLALLHWLIRCLLLHRGATDTVRQMCGPMAMSQLLGAVEDQLSSNPWVSHLQLPMALVCPVLCCRPLLLVSRFTNLLYCHIQRWCYKVGTVLRKPVTRCVVLVSNSIAFVQRSAKVEKPWMDVGPVCSMVWLITSHLTAWW